MAGTLDDPIVIMSDDEQEVEQEPYHDDSMDYDEDGYYCPLVPGIIDRRWRPLDDTDPDPVLASAPITEPEPTVPSLPDIPTLPALSDLTGIVVINPISLPPWQPSLGDALEYMFPQISEGIPMWGHAEGQLLGDM